MNTACSCAVIAALLANYGRSVALSDLGAENHKGLGRAAEYLVRHWKATRWTSSSQPFVLVLTSF
jgi:hypothetical protein